MNKRSSFLIALLLTACGGDDDAGPRSTMTDEQAAQMRDACAFKAGTTAGLSLAKDAPLGKQIPIDTVVVLMMENRSFDHLFGAPGAIPGAETAPDDASNPDPNGMPVKRFHNTEYCFGDTNHEWDGSHEQYNDGKMDRFVVTNTKSDDNGTRAMGYYDANDIPYLYGLANSYATSDRYFAALMGPTFPNREYLYAATTYGRTTNKIFTGERRYNVMELIEDHNANKSKTPISWHIYYDGVPGLAIFIETLSLYLDNVSILKNFYEDAAAGTLANITFLDPNLRDEWGGGNDLHPPSDVQVGDQFINSIVDAVTHSPQWPHTALFITFDEHGGLYDHVPPPKACPPDENQPDTYDFAQYGFRVPFIAVSPYARPHYVSHTVTSHTSILRFLEARFGLPSMTARDANADPLFDLFDFGQAALLVPPAIPATEIDQAKLTACEEKYPYKQIDFNPMDGGTHD